MEEATEQEIMDAKAQIDRAGIGCEPASATTVAGCKKLVEQGVIDKNEIVVGILTGNLLKDTDAAINYHLNKLENIKSNFGNMPIQIEADLEEVKKALG